MPQDIIQVTIAEMRMGCATRGDGWLVIRFSERFFDNGATSLCLRGAASRSPGNEAVFLFFLERFLWRSVRRPVLEFFCLKFSQTSRRPLFAPNLGAELAMWRYNPSSFSAPHLLLQYMGSYCPEVDEGVERTVSHSSVNSWPLAIHSCHFHSARWLSGT